MSRKVEVRHCDVLRGDVCAATYTNNAPLSQVMPCTSGEKLNVLWSAMSDIPEELQR